MAASVRNLGNLAARMSPQVSETLLVTSKSYSQKAPLTLKFNTRSYRRPKSVDPRTFKRNKQNDSSVEANAIPSTSYLENFKSRTLDNSRMRPPHGSSSSPGIKLNLYDKLNYNKTQTEIQNNNNIQKARSWEKFSSTFMADRNKQKVDSDRSTEDQNDRKPSTSGVGRRCYTGLASAYASGSAIAQNKTNTSSIKHHLVAVDRRKPEESFVKAEDYAEEVVELGESKLYNKNVVEGNAVKANPDVKTNDWTTAVQKSVEINLSDIEATKANNKKTLSMDINVLVSVKPQEHAKSSEIGFQDFKTPASENREIVVDIEPKKSKEVMKNNEVEIMSQKDLTEEIGKVYSFLKNNEKLETKILQSTNDGHHVFQNFNKIKNLYFNVLNCVKAFRDLKPFTSEKPASEEFHETKEETFNELSHPEQELLEKEMEQCWGEENEPKYSETKDLEFAEEVGSQEESVNYYEATSTSNGKQKKNFLSAFNSNAMSFRMYSSDGGGEGKSDCAKAKKLPCLQSSELSSGPKDGATTKAVCEKVCMPCCKPARDPPTCFYPYHKPPCKKEKPPRPAFSECKQLFEMKQVTPCECVRPRATSCAPQSKESETCTKK